MKMKVMEKEMKEKNEELNQERERKKKRVMQGKGVMERIEVDIEKWKKIVNQGMKVRFVRNGMRKDKKIRGKIKRIKVRRKWFIQYFI